jgi:chorismate dehydratase
VTPSLRLGSVSYLNARPFLLAMQDLPGVELLPPKDLAVRFAQGGLDIALIPVFDWLLHPAYGMFPHWGICCRGPVYSVVLVHDRPLEQIRTIALDRESLTSVHLLKLLCRRFFRIDPRFVDQGAQADAELWIGDQAIRERAVHPDRPVIDLGEAWREYAGLPFVFAVWALRPGLVLDEPTSSWLDRAFRDGVAQRGRLAASAVEKKYLLHHIRYEIGLEEQQAIERFRRELREEGWIGS